RRSCSARRRWRSSSSAGSGRTPRCCRGGSRGPWPACSCSWSARPTSGDGSRRARRSPGSCRCADRPYGEGVGEPRLPYRVRPLQVLLGVGAVLVVAAAAAVAGVYGGPYARIVFAVLAVIAAALSLVSALDGLRSTEETLAACASGLALVAATWHTGSPLLAGVVAAACLGLHLAARQAAVWPLASWVAL